MVQPHVLEGQWEEIIARNGAELAGRKVRVSYESEAPGQSYAAFPPNEQGLAALRELVRLQEGMKETDGSQTDRRLREARDGGLYGLDPTE